MKKTLVLFSALMLMSLVSLSQSTGNSVSKKDKVENIYTSLKPSDAAPAVFNSQEELNAKIQDKKNNTLELIRKNKDNPEEVKKLREQLWRFEHAIVVTAK